MNEIPATISRFIRAVHAAKAHYSAKTGLELGGGYLLVELAHTEGARLTTLAERCGVDPALVSRQSHALIERGLVERVADPIDGRASLLRLTKAGEKFVSDSNSMKCEFFDQVFSGWTKQERAEFEQMLAKFTEDFIQTTNRNQKAAPDA